MRPEQRHAIFRRFWQGGRDQNGGAGLGMDIAARTVVAHGGVMSVGEAPEGGAIFTMQFEALAAQDPRSNCRRAKLIQARNPFKDCDFLAAVRPL